jgi:hypothetical protein
MHEVIKNQWFEQGSQLSADTVHQMNKKIDDMDLIRFYHW